MIAESEFCYSYQHSSVVQRIFAITNPKIFQKETDVKLCVWLIDDVNAIYNDPLMK